MLYYKATAGWWGWVFVGVSDSRCASAPPPLLSTSHPRSWVVHRCCRSLLRPSSLLRHPLYTHWSHSYSLLRRPAPPLTLLHVQYRIRAPLTLRGPLLLGVSSYPPAFFTPLLALPSYPSFTLSVSPGTAGLGKDAPVPSVGAAWLCWLSSLPSAPSSLRRGASSSPSSSHVAISYCISISMSDSLSVRMLSPSAYTGPLPRYL